MRCDGYDRQPHETDTIHARGLCDACYQKMYRDEHQRELAAYQKAYRQGEDYAAQNRSYVQEFRAKKM